jgi:hypothetical protein
MHWRPREIGDQEHRFGFSLQWFLKLSYSTKFSTGEMVTSSFPLLKFLWNRRVSGTSEERNQTGALNRSISSQYGFAQIQPAMSYAYHRTKQVTRPLGHSRHQSTPTAHQTNQSRSYFGIRQECYIAAEESGADLQGEYIFIIVSEMLLLDYFSILAGVEIGFFSFEVNVQELRANCNLDIRVSKSNTQIRYHANIQESR